ncbi:MAG TPA: hypothetical protein VK158_05045 [Acidobacteriota bacterium]|nr:hypothetical protein [Acidobacteriota bacterium]
MNTQDAKAWSNSVYTEFTNLMAVSKAQTQIKQHPVSGGWEFMLLERESATHHTPIAKMVFTFKGSIESLEPDHCHIDVFGDRKIIDKAESAVQKLAQNHPHLHTQIAYHF